MKLKHMSPVTVSASDSPPDTYAQANNVINDKITRQGPLAAEPRPDSENVVLAVI